LNILREDPTSEGTSDKYNNIEYILVNNYYVNTFGSKHLFCFLYFRLKSEHIEFFIIIIILHYSLIYFVNINKQF